MQYLVLAAAEDIYQHAIEFFSLEGLGSYAALQWNSRKSSAGLRWLDIHIGLFKVWFLCSFRNASRSTVCTWLAVDLSIGNELEFGVLPVQY